VRLQNLLDVSQLTSTNVFTRGGPIKVLVWQVPHQTDPIIIIIIIILCQKHKHNQKL